MFLSTLFRSLMDLSNLYNGIARVVDPFVVFEHFFMSACLHPSRKPKTQGTATIPLQRGRRERR